MTRIGKYEIVGRVGSGGMGEVYRALDPDLRREVAIKVLQPDVFADPSRRRRLEQEARAAGALNHPNLLTIYDLGVHEDAPFIVCELLVGQTLRAALDGYALSIGTVTDYARQIAAGLKAAHDKGIIHRDLKPENIFITADGRVKILDFGLAKFNEPIGADQPTVAHTEPGTMMGTLAYMAPEQVKALSTDHRSDIFAFGSILFEMVSGRPAFRKQSAAETIAAILTSDPASGLSSDVPAGLATIIRRCLEKSPDRRVQTADGLLLALSAQASPAPVVRSSRTVVMTSLAVAVIAAALVVPLRSLWKREKTQAPVDPQAHAAYLRGRSSLERSDPESLSRALLFFKDAVHLDSNYALAYAGLADTYADLGFFGVLLPTEAYPSAKEAAMTAMRLDPNLAEAHVSLGQVLTNYEWKWKEAEEEFRRAIELNPNYDLAYSAYALLLIAIGRADEAIAQSRHASELSPAGRRGTQQLPWMLYLARRYDASILQYQKAIELDPQSIETRENSADALAAAGRGAEAFAQYQQWARMAGYPQPIINDLAQAYAAGGMTGYWRKRLMMEKIEEDQTGDVFPYRMASLHARLHEPAEALDWLERAYSEHNNRLIFLRADPVFDPIRTEAQFQNLLDRVGLR